MTLTLVEASKRTTNVFTRGVIETFTENQRLAQIIPFRAIGGALDGVSFEAVLPGAATRAVNEAFVRSEGRIEDVIQALKFYGGDIGIDPFILQTKGRAQAGRHVAMKIKAISNRWTLDFFKGDSASQPRDFDGLQIRLAGFNVLSAGAGMGGSALALTVLDEGIMRCHSPSYLLMGRQMAIRLTQSGRSTGVTGFVRWDKNELGRQVMFYNDLEVVIVTDNSNNDNILGFTEAATGGGGSTASSIYVCGVGDDGIEGIENGGMQVRNLGEDNATPREDTRIEWYNNFQINHTRAVIRIRDISNAAFVS
jgi:hypothetical protein